MSSYFVIGLGSFGSAVASELFRMGHEVMVIDEQEQLVAKIADNVTHAIVGDAKDESVLKSIGVHNFDGVVVAVSNELSNSILITLLLKEMGVKKIVCKAQGDRHAKALSLIGADIIVRPENDMGKRLAHALAQKNIIEYIEISSDYSIIEFLAPQEWIGKSISENRLRNKFQITVIAIRNSDHTIVEVSPNSDYIIKENDLLVILGSNKNLSKIGAIKI